MRNNGLLQKRMPTILGVALLAIATVISALFVRNNTTNLFGRAAADNVPQNISITNVSDTSFSVSYTTSGKVIGTLSYGKNKDLEKNVFDDRDTEDGVPKEYNTHHITVQNLTKKTKYFFSIVSGGSIFLNNEALFEITTSEEIEDAPTSQDPVSGNIILSDGQPAGDVLVYAETENGSPQSSLAEPDGSYSLPIETMRTTDLLSYVEFSDETVISLIFRNETAESKATVLFSQSNPVPQITLSKIYDFTQGEPIVSDTPQASESGTEQLPVGTIPKEEAPSIISPENKEEFSDQRPRFTGTALPNAIVEITIQSNPIKAQVKADSNGNWVYRPEKPLSPGKHTITILTKDSLGLTKRISESFTVFAQGSQFTEPSVSPSQGTTTPTPTSKQSSPTSTPRPSATSTPTPTIRTPTATLSPIPTIVPTSPTSLTATPVPSIKPTGSETSVALGVGAFGAMLFGLLLFFLMRGGKSL
ncbi:MAG: fibronectin type III domain-containing protein [Candidatus Levybacteria bacterium]|nr:fibronectin type III domain-containing protein [Candidatus Levybacteria bacterium]